MGATTPTFTHSEFNDGDSVTCVVYGTGACGLATINSVVLKVTEPTGVIHTALTNSDIKLMPNPNNGSFVVTGTLGTTANENVAYEITNVLGQVVYSNIGVARNGVVNERIQLSNTLANGMYILNMVAGTERKTFHVVLKQ